MVLYEIPPALLFFFRRFGEAVALKVMRARTREGEIEIESQSIVQLCIGTAENWEIVPTKNHRFIYRPTETRRSSFRFLSSTVVLSRPGFLFFSILVFLPNWRRGNDNPFDRRTAPERNEKNLNADATAAAASSRHATPSRAIAAPRRAVSPRPTRRNFVYFQSSPLPA